MNGKITKTLITSALFASVITFSSCSFQEQPSKPLLFEDDCRKIEAKILESVAIREEIFEDSISGEEAKSEFTRILNYYRSYKKARANSITKDQKLFLAELIEADKFMADWVEIWLIDPWNYPTSTQWWALQETTKLIQKRALVPCSTLTYKEWLELPRDQPIP